MTTLITSNQAATILGIKLQTLRAWRMKGRGPRYVRLGDNRMGRVAYRSEDVSAWIDAHVAGSTSEESVRWDVVGAAQ